MTTLAHLPSSFSRWLGHRSAPVTNQPKHIVWIWTFIGTFLGISLIQAVFGQAHYFIERGVPSIVASYGASAVLIYGVLDSPLAQPRPLLAGHFLAALIGVSITKLFHLLPTEERFQSLLWLAGSLSCATSVIVMQITGTIHPPAGATALLAAVNTEIRDIGWYYLPVILLSSALALVVALITNNIQRRYPVFWFYPSPPTTKAVPDIPSTEKPPSSRETTLNNGHSVA